MQLQLRLQLPLNCTTLYYTNCITLRYARPHITIPHYNTQHYSTLQCTTLITPHHNCTCNCNCATLVRHHYSYIEVRLHYTTTTTTTALRHTTSSSCGEVAAASIATTQTRTPVTFRSISGFSLPSVINKKYALL